jgi:uncharacterized membrane protein YebE (DUF533 family)
LTVILVSAVVPQGYCQAPDSIKIRKTNPTGALFRSAFVPGWGQLYNRKYIKAVLFAGGHGWLAYGIYDNWKKADRHEKNFKNAFDDPLYQAAEFGKFENARDSRNLKMWIMAAVIFYSMFDAYVDAQLSDFDQTDKAFEVYLGPGEKNDFELSLTFYIK